MVCSCRIAGLPEQRFTCANNSNVAGAATFRLNILNGLFELPVVSRIGLVGCNLCGRRSRYRPKAAVRFRLCHRQNKGDQKAEKEGADEIHWNLSISNGLAQEWKQNVAPQVLLFFLRLALLNQRPRNAAKY